MRIFCSSRRAASATLIFGVVLLLPFLDAAAARNDNAVIEVHAASRPLVLTAHPNDHGGKQILARRFDVALSKLAAADLGSRSLTNLCVVRTVSKEWIKARSACDAAVEAALRERKRAWYKSADERVRPDTHAAIAYANRAVMFLLSRDIAAGRSDLLHARLIRPNASYVTDNFAALCDLDHDLLSSMQCRYPRRSLVSVQDH